jgi:5-hydroxyisourate hydrolase-like protein (transthyretin family)
MGAQRRVTVTAALNANTNPNLSLEWYVNGVKQAQTSRIFDFTPTEVGSFAIQAKIGNLSSNTLTVALGLPVFAVESLVFKSASQLIMKAPAGASVTLTGAELADTSRYDLVNEEYVLDLEEAVTQGTTVTVRLEKEGSQPLVETVIYDTRTFTLDEVTFGIGANVEELSAVDGVFTVEKPIDKGAVFVRTYKIAFDATDLFPATGTVAFTKELTVPSGATAVATTTANIQNLSSTVSQFDVKHDSAVGLYTHKFTLGGKVVEVKVNVVEQTPTIELLPAFVFKNTTTKANELVEFVVDKAGNENHTPVKLGADGVYEVTKPFTTFNPATPDATNTFNFEFIFHAFGFPIVENFENSFSVGLNGPIEAGSTITSVLSGVFTENTDSRTTNSAAITSLTAQMTGTTAETLVIALNDTATTSTLHANASSSTSAIAHVDQIIDRGSPEGVYTFTIKAGQLGKEISKEVKVRLVEPKASVDFVVSSYESTNRKFVVDRSVTDTITIERPLGAAVASLEWYTILRNYQSPVATIAEINADALVTDAEDKQTFSSSTANSADFELWGAAETLHGSTAIGAPLAGIGTNTYKFVNYSLTVTGPSNLITNLEARKAAMLLTAETDTVIMVEGLDSARQTTVVEAALTAAGRKLETALQNDGSGTELTNQVGLNRDPLTIDSSVVSGTYTIKFIVGDLSKTLTLNIVEPKATIFTKSGINSVGAAVVADTTNKFQTAGAGYSRLLTGQDSTDSAGNNTIAGPAYNTISWTALSSGKYTIYQKDKNLLSVNSDMFIADMPAGTYNYNIVKKYPDGRAETFVDTVTISALNPDGVATIATNAKFSNAFNISEFDMETGVYEYSFTVGSLTREFVVEVLENRKIKLGTLTLGTSNVTFYNGMYRIPAAGNGTITPRTIKVDVELVNLLETSFYGVVRSAPSAGFSVTEVDEIFTKASLVVDASVGTVATGFKSLKGLTTLDLGKLSATTLLEGDNIVYTITFYNRTVEYGVASFAVTGETIVLTLTADDGVAATPAPAPAP